MPLPTYDQLMLPLMKLLSELNEPIKISDAANILAERSNLHEEDLNKILPSGKNIFKDRVAWAKTYLVKAGLVQQPKRAYCEISSLGRQVDLKSLDAIFSPPPPGPTKAAANRWAADRPKSYHLIVHAPG